ncbi:hypothetical protein I79_010536 [Cricetulus griseus]|uniref:Uncharacterized protein n=1 Tax=Cricetulus griseus TaxID=10029 RepID=G3HIR0_CRIGR|nr:hypothetical protein I79_010536 [Cricetulus griseus]
MKLVRLWDLRRKGSVQRAKSQLCEEEGSGEAHQGSLRSFISNLSRNGLWNPSFDKGKNLQNSKNQISKKKSRITNYAAFGLVGKREKKGKYH